MEALTIYVIFKLHFTLTKTFDSDLHFDGLLSNCLRKAIYLNSNSYRFISIPLHTQWVLETIIIFAY